MEYTKGAPNPLTVAQGLGAPVGSIVAGPKDFIAKVHHHRKMLGGGMRQAGVLAAPGGWLTAVHSSYARAKLVQSPPT